MSHLPYSSDLAPNYFFLYHYIKNKLHYQRFSKPKKAIEAFKMHVLELSETDWKKCFENLIERMKKYIDYHGEYFEKQ